MSKYVKDLISQELRQRLEGVTNALLVDVIGIDANQNMVLRRTLREKGIHLLVVKNSLARRATEGTPLAPALHEAEGTLALAWGGEDIVTLAKEVARIAEDDRFSPFAARGGVMDGEAMSAEEVEAVSKWPSREEQLSLLVGQILGPGGQLGAQLLNPGGWLASQIEKKGKEPDT